MAEGGSDVVGMFEQAANEEGYCDRIGCRCPVDLQPSMRPHRLPREPKRPESAALSVSPLAESPRYRSIALRAAVTLNLLLALLGIDPSTLPPGT